MPTSLSRLSVQDNREKNIKSIWNVSIYTIQLATACEDGQIGRIIGIRLVSLNSLDTN